jgi:hypothetical protein
LLLLRVDGSALVFDASPLTAELLLGAAPLHSASEIGESLLLSVSSALPFVSFASRLGMFWLLWLPFR